MSMHGIEVEYKISRSLQPVSIILQHRYKLMTCVTISLICIHEFGDRSDNRHVGYTLNEPYSEIVCAETNFKISLHMSIVKHSLKREKKENMI